MKNKLVRIIAAVLAIIWMIVIFSYSSDTAEVSSEVSTSVSYQLVDSAQKFLGLNWEDSQIQTVADNIEWMVRKAAHMTEYGILGTLIGIALYVWQPVDYSQTRPRLIWLIRPGIDVMICGLYASSDEFHQTFVDGRSGKPTDVLIDLAGTIICLVLITVFTHIHYKNKQNKTKAIS